MLEITSAIFNGFIIKIKSIARKDYDNTTYNIAKFMYLILLILYEAADRIITLLLSFIEMKKCLIYAFSQNYRISD